MILFDSTFVNSLGGINVLTTIIKSIDSHNRKLFILLVDIRNKKLEFEKYNGFNQIIYCNNNLFSRFLLINKLKKNFDVIFTLGNVPNLVLSEKYQLTYNMQSLIFEYQKLKYPNNIKWFFKSQVIKLLFKLSNSDVAVQTKTMQVLFERIFKNRENKIHSFPVFKDIKIKQKTENRNQEYVYISSGEKYKNVELLIRSFSKFQKKYPKEKLHLTINKNHNNLIDLIDYANSNSKHSFIFNHGSIINKEALSLLMKNKFLVHPSAIESFGIVLIEGSYLNNIIIAPDLNYVYDVCEPNITFKLNEESLLNALFLSKKNDFKPKPTLINNKSRDLINYLILKNG